MSLTPEQRHVLKTVKRVGKEMGASPKVMKAAVETIIVEANLRNPKSATDHDSLGAFQQRPSQGWGSPGQVTNVEYAAKQFFKRAIPNRGKYGSAGQLAQSVQRSAYPDRYDQAGGRAEKLLGDSPGARTSVGPVTGTAGGSDLQAQARRQAAAEWLLSSSKSTADLQNRVSRAEASVPVQAKTPTTVKQGSGSTPLASAAKARADQIDAKKLPYQWGGGHGGKVDPASASPLDCSGAVSAVIGINPRVSGDFQRWGRPGRAPGGKGITIYSNPTHVLMEIDGHFWGTSKSNPGGGAGWIPRSQVSPAYLAGFTARHSKR